ncbi:MAG: hypothetical protein IT352_00045 [Gemmatimonadales bacterium]|nr:hypothetical protein [Gemmatimonadales bacterium]
MFVGDRWKWSVVMILGMGGCVSETGPSEAGLNGSFGGRLLESMDFVGFSVVESGGVLSGLAWSSIVPGLARATPLTGSRSGTSVTLTIPNASGLGPWVFNGTWADDSLRGEFAQAQAVGFGFLVRLGRIDTIPSGNASISVSGSEQHAGLQGSALFGYDSADHPVVITKTAPPFAATTQFTWNGKARPGRGAYLALGNAVSSITLTRDPDSNPINYSVTGGTVFVDYSNRFTLVGRVELTARSPSGQVVTLAGSYSAGCQFGYC